MHNRQIDFGLRDARCRASFAALPWEDFALGSTPRFVAQVPANSAFLYGKPEDLNLWHNYEKIPLNDTPQANVDDLPCPAYKICSEACNQDDVSERVDVVQKYAANSFLLRCSNKCDFFFKCSSNQNIEMKADALSNLGEMASMESQYKTAEWIAELYQTMYGNPPEGASLVEFGAAAGVLSSLMRGMGFKLRGLEMWKPWYDFAVRTWALDLYNIRISEAPRVLGASSANVVVGFQTAEYFPLQDKDLRYLYTLLRENGMFITCVPNAAATSVVCMAEEGSAWYEKYEPVHSELHLSLWTRKSLATTMSNVGYRTVYNEGMDFGAHNVTLEWLAFLESHEKGGETGEELESSKNDDASISHRHRRLIFLNSSARRPFLPKYLPEG